MKHRNNFATSATKLICWNSKKDNQGKVPVYLQFYVDGCRRFKSTGIWIKLDDKSQILPKLKKVFTEELDTKVTLRSLLNDYETSDGNRRVISEAISIYEECLKKSPTTDNLHFSELYEFRSFLEKRGNSNSTVSNRLRSIRTIYSFAKSLGITIHDNPFRKGLIPVSVPNKKTVDWYIPEGNIWFELQCRLGGLDLIDAVNIVSLGLEEGIHKYTRVKNERKGTLQYIFVSIASEDIIKSLEIPNNYESFRRAQNKKLSKFGLSSKSPRYMVAQKLEELRCEKSTISKILGHRSEIVTDRYLRNEFDDAVPWVNDLNKLVDKSVERYG